MNKVRTETNVINEDALFFTSAVTPDALRDMEKNLGPAIRDVASKIARVKSPRIYFIGGGASLSTSYCGKYLFNRFTSIPSDAVNGWQILSGIPEFMDANSFVFATSYSGETPEVLECVQKAGEKGATTIAITNTKETPLAKACSHTLDYHSKAVFTVPAAILYQLASDVMRSRKESVETADQISAQLKTLPELMQKQYENTRLPAQALAETFVNEPGFYVLASGPAYGLGYKLALSVVIENLWVDSCPIEAGDFYHGPIEIVSPDKGTRQNMAFIHLVGTDGSRHASEQAIAFCKSHNSRQMIFDAKDYPEFGELFSPFALFTPTEWFIMYMSALKNHDVDERRYMGKIAAKWGEYA